MYPALSRGSIVKIKEDAISRLPFPYNRIYKENANDRIVTVEDVYLSYIEDFGHLHEKYYFTVKEIYENNNADLTVSVGGFGSYGTTATTCGTVTRYCFSIDEIECIIYNGECDEKIDMDIDELYIGLRSFLNFQ